ncbi:MAG TPA: DUF3037 domain-containing protein [Parasegetibacter sp.]|jgi:hypothetical protein
MQEKHLFEYAIIRAVPRVEREEFVNIGVILYCKKANFLKTRFYLNKEKIQALCQETDIELLEKYIEALERIAAGDETAGPIAKLDLPSRFRWLTATRSTILQTSKVHPGLCDDLGEMLDRLFEEMVG